MLPRAIPGPAAVPAAGGPFALVAGGAHPRAGMSTGSALALAASMLALSVVPGPSDVAVIARSVAAGPGQGLLMVAGIIGADLLFILAAVYSLAVIAGTLGGLFDAVRALCAGYLLWLGVRTWRGHGGTGEAAPGVRGGALASFGTGLFITLGDPKAILFYMGFLPAFVDLAAVTPADILAIMLIATVVVGSVKGTYALLAGRAGAFLHDPRARRRANHLAGLVLMATGAFLLVTIG